MAIRFIYTCAEVVLCAKVRSNQVISCHNSDVNVLYAYRQRVLLVMRITLKQYRRLIEIWLLAFLGLGLQASLHAQHIPFVDVAQQMGIDYSFSACEFAGGVSFADVNVDGLPDVSFGSCSNEPVHIFIQGRNGLFSDQGGALLPHERSSSRALLWADYDNDADQDLFVVNSDAPCRFYEQIGGQLIDRSLDAGIDLQIAHSWSAAWADYNNDGFLDLYVAARNLTRPSASPNKLYRNNGDGTFTECAATAGVADSAGLSFQVVFSDFNNDGWQDIYVANDKYFSPNKLFINDQNGGFQDVSNAATTGIAIDAMGLAVADINGDQYMDVYMTNTPWIEQNVMLSSDGLGGFVRTDSASSLGVGLVGWGCNFADFDADGDYDLFVANGGMGSTSTTPNVLFQNTGSGNFFRDSLSLISNDSSFSFGSAVADFNGDGKLDLAVMNSVPSKFRLYQNQSSGANYLKLSLEGTVSNRGAIGSRVRLYSAGNTIDAELSCGGSFAAQSSKELYFGLGNTDQFDSLVVFWPSGFRSTMAGGDANQHLYLIEDTSSSTVHYCSQPIADSSTRITEQNAVLHWSSMSTVQLWQLRGGLVGSPDTLTLTIDGTESSFHASRLNTGATYWWAVRYLCNSLTGEWSAESEKRQFTTRCARPINCSSEVLSANSAVIQWGEVQGSFGYELIVTDDSGFRKQLQISNAAYNQLGSNRLSSGETYHWKVRSVCNADATLFSAYSDLNVFTTFGSAKNGVEPLARQKYIDVLGRETRPASNWVEARPSFRIIPLNLND